MKKIIDNKKTQRLFLLSEYGKQKLLGYADSFREIAKTLEEDFDWEKEETRQSRLYNRKLWENRCLLAENLNEMAGVMAQVAGEVFSYRPFPERKAKQITQVMKSEGILVQDLYYIDKSDGRVRLTMSMRTDKSGGISTEETAHFLSVLLDKRLVPSINSAEIIDGNYRNYTFAEELPERLRKQRQNQEIIMLY